MGKTKLDELLFGLTLCSILDLNLKLQKGRQMICNICYNNRKPTRKQGLSPKAEGTELSSLVNYSTN